MAAANWYVDIAHGADTASCGTSGGSGACRTLDYVTNSRIGANSGQTVFVAPGTYQEHNFQFPAPVTIIGAGAGATSFSGGGVDRVFITYPRQVVNLTDLSITGGYTNAVDGGAGVYNYGVLTLTRVTVTGNQATAPYIQNGGGLLNAGGTINLVSSTISANIVTASEATGEGHGGGISNVTTDVFDPNKIAYLNITNSTIAGNSTPKGNGAGIDNEDGVVTITNSEIRGNIAAGGGAGIWALGPNTGSMRITSTLFSNNTANRGGGIYNYNIPLSLSNTTFSGNTTSRDGGGAIYAAGGGGSIVLPISALHVTVASNTGGGIYNYDSTDPFTIRNSIVAYNSTSSGFDCAGYSVTSQDYNIERGETCLFLQPHDLEDTDPLLAALADNGGPTHTHALMPGSRAIDRVPLSPYTCATPSDQRGYGRPQGAACDAGAYEYVPPIPSITAIAPTQGATTGGAHVTITGTGFVTGAAVAFDGIAATSVVVVSGTLDHRDCARARSRFGKCGGLQSRTPARQRERVARFRLHLCDCRPRAAPAHRVGAARVAGAGTESASIQRVAHRAGEPGAAATPLNSVESRYAA